MTTALSVREVEHPLAVNVMMTLDLSEEQSALISLSLVNDSGRVMTPAEVPHRGGRRQEGAPGDGRHAATLSPSECVQDK